jgi:PmbA protein
VSKTQADKLQDVARKAVELAKARGAREAGAVASHAREVSVTWRDGKLEKVNEATTRGVSIELYVDGRYGVARTGDLRPDALAAFVAESVTMTRSIAPDPFRSLPDPELCRGQAKVDLELDDPSQATLAPEKRRAMTREIEDAARSVEGAGDIISVTAGFGDERRVTWRVHSNGFEGRHGATSFSAYAVVSVKDPDGRRPEDWSAAATRFYGDLPPVAGEGKRAALRALDVRGARKIPSGVMPMLVDNRVAGRLLFALAAPLSGKAIQQKRSFLEGKLGARLGSGLFTVVDDPLIPRALGSQLFDGEGLAARKRTLFENGTLKTFYIDTYYGKKLKLPPTTGSASNVTIAPGTQTQQQLMARMGTGIFVTAFLGGNSNSTTGDFSFGVQGFRIEKGQRARPVSEMNISGSLADVWTRLVAVGNDPYPYSRMRLPTLLFEGVQFAGS